MKTVKRGKAAQPRDEFAAILSRELRKPSTVIIGALKTVLAEEDRLPRKALREILEDAAGEADTLSDMLHNLIELSRVQVDNPCLRMARVNVRQVTERLVDKLRQGKAGECRFALKFPPALPPVRADELGLERILTNLLENALVHSPPAGQVWVSAVVHGGHVVVRVKDQGPGIIAGDRSKGIHTFERKSGEGHVTGTGLRLYVCQRLVDVQGGRIWVESEAGKGTTFFFSLPVWTAMTSDPSPAG